MVLPVSAVVEKDFLKYMDVFKPFLLASLKNHVDYQVSLLDIIGSFSTVSSSYCGLVTCHGTSLYDFRDNPLQVKE